MGPVMPESPGPHIIEAYKNYSPPPQVLGIVGVLLKSVPPEHLTGLKTIVLTNCEALSHDQRRRKLWSRGRKAGMHRVLGSYHQAWKGDAAWIDLFVDQIVYRYTFPFMFRLPVLPYIPFSSVLYHEIGHHIHKTSRPEFNEREDVANRWRDKLNRSFLRRRYWYLMPVLFPLSMAVRFWDKHQEIRRSRARRAL